MEFNNLVVNSNPGPTAIWDILSLSDIIMYCISFIFWIVTFIMICYIIRFIKSKKRIGLKIFLTNIQRFLTGLLFIDITAIFINNISQPTCYAMQYIGDETVETTSQIQQGLTFAETFIEVIEHFRVERISVILFPLIIVALLGITLFKWLKLKNSNVVKEDENNVE